MATTKNRDEAAEHLADALEVDECAEKEFHIRQALQLLTLEER